MDQSAGHGLRNLDLRRAVMRVLLRAQGPVRVADIVHHLETVEHIAVAEHRAASPAQRVSNLLGWQVRCGRVEHVGRGLYLAVPSKISRTTRWRIEHWDELGPDDRISRRRQPDDGGR